MADLGDIAAVATFCAAVVGLFIAVSQIRASREIEAQNAYEAYHHLALSYPQFAFGDFDFRELEPREQQRYRTYVLSMLLTVERILGLFPGDKYWRAAFVDDISNHRQLLQDASFEHHFSSLDPRVVRVMRDTFKSMGAARD